MQKVDDFVESLLTDKGITDLEPEVRKELKEELKTRLLEQINRNAVLELDEVSAAELVKKVDDPNFTEDKMSQFMQDSGVDLARVALDTMVQFRNFYLGSEA